MRHIIGATASRATTAAAAAASTWRASPPICGARGASGAAPGRGVSGWGRADRGRSGGAGRGVPGADGASAGTSQNAPRTLSAGLAPATLHGAHAREATDARGRPTLQGAARRTPAPRAAISVPSPPARAGGKTPRAIAMDGRIEDASVVDATPLSQAAATPERLPSPPRPATPEQREPARIPPPTPERLPSPPRPASPEQQQPRSIPPPTPERRPSTAPRSAAVSRPARSPYTVPLRANSAILEVAGSLDAVVVLGGGLTESGTVPAAGERRLALALEIAAERRRLGHPGLPLLISGGGSPHNPPALSPRGRVVHEAEAYAAWMLTKGTDPGDLYTEVSSYDTVGNAYFSLVTHVLPARWRRIALVTSEFHAPRSLAIFGEVFVRIGSRAAGAPIEVVGFAATDEGLFPKDVLEARAAKEARAAETFLEEASHLADLKDLHAWLHATHLCYAVSRVTERHDPRPLDPTLARSY